MRILIFIGSILIYSSYCAPKQLKKNANNHAIDLSSQMSVEINSAKNEIAKLKDTSILGVPYYKIDSFQKAGKESGGIPSSDSTTAMFLKLSDSIRRIGPYELRYNGQFFLKQELNRKHNNQLDLEIKEERKGIVSIHKRMFDKPDYFPLLNQQIEFYNENNHLISAYNINKHNPFLSDKSKKIKEYVYPPPNNKSELIVNSDDNWKHQVKKYYSYNRFHVQENGYVIVEYQLYAMDAYEGILKSVSTLVVLDSTGKEFIRFNELENTLHYYWMASGGKYLMLNGGGILGEGFQRLEKPFLKIYEVNSKKMIYSESLDQSTYDYGDFYESESPEKIMVSYRSYKKSNEHLFTQLIFDLNNKKRCIKSFSESDWNKITNEGIKYSGNEWLQKFNFDCKTF